MLNGLNIEHTIQISKNASIKTKECPLRRNEVLLIRKIGYEKSKQLEHTGRQWIAEGVFSSLNGM